MIIIKCEAKLKPEKLHKLTEYLQSQVKTGTIVLPDFCHLVTITAPEEGKITVINDAPTYSLRKNGVICSASDILYCGYTPEEIKKLQAQGFELYAGNIKLEL